MPAEHEGVNKEGYQKWLREPVDKNDFLSPWRYDVEVGALIKLGKSVPWSVEEVATPINGGHGVAMVIVGWKWAQEEGGDIEQKKIELIEKLVKGVLGDHELNEAQAFAFTEKLNQAMAARVEDLESLA